MKTLERVILWSLLSFVIAFGTPILSIFTILGVTNILDCDLTSKGPMPCQFLWWDIGERLYAYALPIIGSLFSPIALFSAFGDIILIWVGLWFVVKFSNKFLKQKTS